MPSPFLPRLSRRAVLASGLTAIGLESLAQTYPTKPIRLIVPFPPGGPTDVLARIVSGPLSERLGQSVVIENKAGASGMLGAQAVAKAAPDGYTLLVNASIHVINPSLYPKQPYDALADFSGISNLADVPLVLTVNTKSPVRSVKELTDWARNSKPALAFASAGNATSQHLCAEAFKMAAGIDLQHIPYKGSAPALTDLIGGQVQLMFDSLPSSLPFIKSGVLRPLAVSSPQRAKALPDVPTLAESGYPQFNITTWYGLWAPAATPNGVIQTLARDIAAIVRAPDVRSQFEKLGAEPVGNPPTEFNAFTKAELSKWAAIVKLSGARVD